MSGASIDRRLPTDLILLAGQSNMSGRGIGADPGDLSYPGVFQFGNSGDLAGRIGPAVEPLSMHDEPSGIGPGVAFARHHLRRRPRRQVLLVPVAHGGTALVSDGSQQWCWQADRPGPLSLFENAAQQGAAAMAAAGRGARWVAALWVQGETDGDRGVSGPRYAEALAGLIAAMRARLDTPDLPFVIGGMVPDFLDRGTRAEIDAAQEALADDVERVGYARGPAGRHLADGNHYSVAGQLALARRMFLVHRHLVDDRAG